MRNRGGGGSSGSAEAAPVGGTGMRHVQVQGQGRGKARRRNLADWVCVVWFLLDATTHLTIELGYLYLALGSTAATSDSWLGFVWREYGRADARWAVRDANIISLELITVGLYGPLCLLQAYAIYAKKDWRHFLQVVICVGELYGGWMTFAPEWISGNPNLDGSTFILLWIYLVFMNGLWVLVPGVLLFDSAAQIIAACRTADTEGAPRTAAKGAPSNLWYYIVAITLIVYSILVPWILFTAPGVPVTAAEQGQASPM